MILFLARWMSGELSAEELQKFEKSEEYSKYVQIVETLETAEVTEFNLEDNFQATLEKIALEKNEKKKRVIPLWSYGVAASLAIVFLLCIVSFSPAQRSLQNTQSKLILNYQMVLK